MATKRQQVGETHQYNGRTITVRHLGPDCLGYVDDVELSGFYLTPSAAATAAERYINDELKAKEKKA